VAISKSFLSSSSSDSPSDLTGVTSSSVRDTLLGVIWATSSAATAHLAVHTNKQQQQTITIVVFQTSVYNKLNRSIFMYIESLQINQFQIVLVDQGGLDANLFPELADSKSKNLVGGPKQFLDSKNIQDLTNISSSFPSWMGWQEAPVPSRPECCGSKPPAHPSRASAPPLRACNGPPAAAS